ncbi:response regulator transcription factor [Brucella sp. BE17]|uniref:response regulator transcription factor n=1 Tax=Brucella sp. BE17 TaxID=3142977 RepID=UPI0031BB6DCA
MTNISPKIEPTRVLLVEDDNDLRQSLADYLRLRKMSVKEAVSGLEFYRALSQQTFDVAVLDVNLPDTSGFELVTELSAKNNMGIIMLTARTGREDRLRGYSEGADLYMTKPVDSEELALAINNLVKRTRKNETEKPSILPPKETVLWLNLQKRVLLTSNQQQVKLSTRELLLFEHLIENPGKTIKRDAVIKLFTDAEPDPDSRRLDAALARLRAKFQVAEIPFPVQIVHGLGLRLNISIQIV